MAAPEGNQNAKGSKGGGRAKAGDIRQLAKIWNGDIDVNDILYRRTETKTQKITHFSSGMNAFAYKVLVEGDIKALLKLVDKLYASPQSIDHTTQGDKITPIYGGQSIQGHGGNKEDIQSEQKD